jgi:hypothetical protein
MDEALAALPDVMFVLPILPKVSQQLSLVLLFWMVMERRVTVVGGELIACRTVWNVLPVVIVTDKFVVGRLVAAPAVAFWAMAGA